MISAAQVLGSAMLFCLIIYSLSGGADFGGGVWDMLAFGPRAEEQRTAIRKAIGPIWEANHVWLIAVIVLLFVAFPKAYSTLGTVLHIPLTLMLVGIVLRGSAFIFRSYGAESKGSQALWNRTFSIASTITPVMLGITLGAVISGQLPAEVIAGKISGKLTFYDVYVSPWLQPFPVVLGFFVLVLFAFLAAVYLCVEVEDAELQNDFRLRAIWSGVAVGVVAWLCIWLGQEGAPRLVKGLAASWWGLPFQLLIGAIALAALVALWKKRYSLARWLAMIQIGGIVLGWGVAQYPYIIVPHMTFANTAAPDSVLWPVVAAFAVGTVLIVPAFGYLYKTFKGNGQEPSE